MYYILRLYIIEFHIINYRFANIVNIKYQNNLNTIKLISLLSFVYAMKNLLRFDR